MAVVASKADCTPRCKSSQHCGELAQVLLHSVAEEAALAWVVRHCHTPGRAKDTSGRTLVHLAASRGLLTILEWLLKQKDVSLNGKDTENGYSPLHRAAFHGQLRTVVFLLQKGANIALVDNDGLTVLDHLVLDRPLHVAYERSAPLEPYLWGSNSNYNLGLGTNTIRTVPDLLDQFRRSATYLSSVSLGKFHSGFVTSAGVVLTCGHGRGGRLGHGSETMQLLPSPVTLPGPCISLALGLDHTVFLCEGGTVLTCGMNTYHQLGHHPPPTFLLAPAPCTARGVKALGVAAARFHSLYWTADSVYTWGLNAGQLGHIKGDKTVVQPKLVASLVGREGGVARVVSSDGAVVVVTSRGDVLALYEYTTKKLGQRQHGVVQLQVTGGQLDSQVDSGGRLDNIDFKLVAGGGSSLKVFILSAHGKISVWEEQRENSFIPCVFSLSREVIVSDVALHRSGLLIISKGGEAWTGIHQQGKAVKSPKSQTFDLIKLKRIPHIHRAVSAVCDSKGRNFAILQVTPNEALTLIPEVSASVMANDMSGLLNEASEYDSLHDVICQVGNHRFLAHSFILASGSESLSKRLRFAEEAENQGHLMLEVEDVHPEIFRLLLQFLYYKSCDLFKEGASAVAIPVMDKSVEGDEQNILEVNGNPTKVSAFQVYNENKVRRKKQSKAKTETDTALKKAKSRCPLALLQEAGKTLGVYGLSKVADCFRIVDGIIIKKTRPPLLKLEFSYKNVAELHDVTISTEDDKEVFAHKCVLVARSDYFCGMFTSGWTESTSVLKLPIPTNIVEAVIDYLYRDDCMAVNKSEDLEFVTNVLVVADQFLIARLKEICECQLTKMLTLRNAAEILQFAVNYSAIQLQSSCMQFICLNLPALLENKSLQILEEDVFKHLDKFYRGSNPVFNRRTMHSMSGYPSIKDVEDEFSADPMNLEDLEGTMENIGASNPSRQRRHSSGDKGGRRSPRVRKTSMESTGSGSENEEDTDVNADIENNFDKLSLVDFEIEEKDEEAGGNICPSSPAKTKQPDKSYFSSLLSQSPSQSSKPSPTNVSKPEKKGRLSQKERKRLTLELETSKSSEDIPAPQTATPKLGWLGWGATPEKNMSNSPSLAEIMKMECKPSIEDRKVTTPQSGHIAKSPTETDKKSEKKTSWKKIELGEEIKPKPCTQSPPSLSNTNPWNIPNSPIPANNNFLRNDVDSLKKESFEQIMKEDVRQKENLYKAESKPLSVTQIEERAIEELRVFYNAENVTDEVITVSRVPSASMAPPIWKRVRK